MKPGAMYGCCVLGVFLSGVNCYPAASSAFEMDIPPNLLVPGVGANATSLEAKLDGKSVELLARVREANEALYSSLQSFVCDEQMERFRGTLNGENTHHVDTITTKVSFESGVEHYSEILQDRRSRNTISSMAGAWSEGEFGTLLEQTQVLLNTQPVLFRMFTEMNGAAAAIYEVQIPEDNSPWDLAVENHHYRIPFRTDVWVSQTTGEIMKIVRISTAIPSQVGISEIRWGVTLQSVQLNDRKWLLPKAGIYAVLYAATDRREWNELTFSKYHRYGSEVALRFQ